MKINELISSFEIWITNEERSLLKKFKEPTRISSLSEHEQFRVEAMVRKSILTKVGEKDPTVVINEKFQ
jgi:hypothetical protein